MGKSPSEAYYLSRVIGLASEGSSGCALESVRETGYPTRGRLAYAVEKAAIQIRDLPGGMILILLTFFASLFAFVWATQTWDSGGGRHHLLRLFGPRRRRRPDVDLRDLYRYLYQVDKQVAPYSRGANILRRADPRAGARVRDASGTPGTAEESLLAAVPSREAPVLIELEKVPVARLS